ncbi:PREDICTED: basic salivary proline-rich protein 2-like [Cyprinodon variegatus]|uniref:basic salivary proline-rich protein 2-like n=1 Tax=Cyprinodon variegatus TaxID=28743 RepID=UPI0007428A36|nr:PREDICTED: basic salivary proline-rich protein 2-like [Cyprinodon variegatus]
MPAPRGAAGTSLRAPPAAGHPEVGPGTEHRPPHGTDRNAPAPQSTETRPAPRHQAPATDRNTHRDRTTQEKHTSGSMRIRLQPHPTKTDANSVQRNTPRTESTAEKPPGAKLQEEQTAAGATKPKQRSHVRRTQPPPQAHQALTGPDTRPEQLRRPGPPTRAGQSHSNPHPPRSLTRRDQRGESSSAMPPKGKTHPSTQSAQPARPHRPPNIPPPPEPPGPPHTSGSPPDTCVKM